MNDETCATLSLAEAEDLALRAFLACGCGPLAAQSTAKALAGAEADGQKGHGLSRVPSYAAQLKNKKIDGAAVPIVRQTRSGAISVDAKGGFAYPALDLAIEALDPLARAAGIAFAGIHASHHIGQAGRIVERLADRGLIGLVASNTPRAMAFHGGARPMMGTNPIAFAAPAPGRPPLVIDMALSQVARSRIVAAQKAGSSIPADWAMDRHGEPTMDPTKALAGALAPAGGAKGAALALMVEILCGALAGGAFGWAASSFLDDQGPPPSVGQILIAVDPDALGSGFMGRMGELARALGEEDGVRAPGDRRLALRDQAQRSGVAIPRLLLDEITVLGRGG